MGVKKDLGDVLKKMEDALKDPTRLVRPDIEEAMRGIDKAVANHQAKKMRKILPLLERVYDDLDDFRTWLELKKWEGDSAASSDAVAKIKKVIQTAKTAELEVKKQ